MIIRITEIKLCFGNALNRSFTIPFNRFGFIFGYSLTFIITKAEAALSGRITLFGGLAIPFHSLVHILGYAFAVCIRTTEIELCLGNSLFRCFTKPLYCFN